MVLESGGEQSGRISGCVSVGMQDREWPCRQRERLCTSSVHLCVCFCRLRSRWPRRMHAGQSWRAGWQSWRQPWQLRKQRFVTALPSACDQAPLELVSSWSLLVHHDVIIHGSPLRVPACSRNA
eukprot:scaffold4320_cov21-Tisochrysis_lutea.AAC.4